MNIEQYERLSMQKLEDSLKKKATLDGVTIVDRLSFGSSNTRGAMQIEAFYSCVRDKAESIGQLPNKLYRRDKSGKRTRVTDGRAFKLWCRRPCEFLSWQGFKEMMVLSHETIGAFYAYPVRNTRGEIMELVPFRNQSNVRPNMTPDGQVYYTYTMNDSTPVVAWASDLFIVSFMTTDGYTPVRPVTYMSTLLGIASSQEDSYKELQEKGITAQMALSTDNIFKDENAIKRLKDDWTKFRGPSGRGEIPVLENGLKPVSLQLTPQEMDALKSREFSVDRIARMTRVPLHRVGMADKVPTKGVVTELDEMYMRNSLNPILVKYEQEICKFIDPKLEFEVDRKAFYQGSPWRLVEAVEREVKGGLATINEGREDLSREPVEGGDVFAVDNNNVTYGTWDQLPSIREQIYGREGNQDGNQTTETED
jgi:HK97 family phage portal protein